MFGGGPSALLIRILAALGAEREFLLYGLSDARRIALSG
jgi:hypothetical protein